jgi:hypothetical protein
MLATMSNYTIGSIRHHQKASEAYVNVTFKYETSSFNWDIPIEYRRTGTHFLEKSKEELIEYLSKVFEDCNPNKFDAWRKEQVRFWAEKPNAGTTKAFFDVLVKSFTWMSVESDFPKNPNWARRIQDIKEFGFTLATNTAMYDKKLGANCTHILLIPLPRGGITGYEVWSKEQREKIITVLGAYDCFEGKVMKKEGLLPDHKFPEIRWDENTKRLDLSSLSSLDIKRDFQLLNNQRNQQKREVCRSCYQSGERGKVFGINFFYSGSYKWDKTIPIRGKNSEKGCVGCAWYDMEKWRQAINSFLNTSFK